MKKKVCRNCRLFVEGSTCPLCKGNQFSESWQGRISIIDSEKSDIAKKLDIKVKGDYVIKIR